MPVQRRPRNGRRSSPGRVRAGAIHSIGVPPFVEYARAGASRRRDSRRTRRRRASRALLGRGAGMTVPGKLLSKLDPGAIDRLAARLPAGVAVISATNGKTTTAAMAAEILRPRFRLAHNHSGANLVSGVASTLLAAEDAELGLLEVDEGALPEVLRRVRPAGRLPRQPLPRPARPLRRARARSPSAGGRPSPTSATDTILVLNGDDPQIGSLAEQDDRLRRRRSHASRGRRLQHAADSKYCIRCGTPYDYRAAYVGHLGDYHCPNCGHARPALDVAARSIELHGLERAAFDLVTPAGTQRVELGLPGLYNVYNALGAAALAQRARRVARRDRRRARPFQRRVRPLRAHPGRAASSSCCS